jgi:hypothetical protein
MDGEGRIAKQVGPWGRDEWVYWDHNGPSDESWPDLASWIRDVWLEEND